MSNHAAEHAEHQITKGDTKHGAHTANLQQEAQSLLGGMVNNVKQAAQEVQHLDFSDPFKAAGDAVKQAGSAVGHTAEVAWNGLDNDKNGHFLKHDICDDKPGLAVVAGTAAIGGAVIVGMIAAPEALAAAGITGAAAMIPSLSGVMSAGALKFDYDRRHPN